MMLVSGQTGQPRYGCPADRELGQCDAAQSARAEALRLLYVGLTRARDRLLLVLVPGRWIGQFHLSDHVKDSRPACRFDFDTEKSPPLNTAKHRRHS